MCVCVCQNLYLYVFIPLWRIINNKTTSSLKTIVINSQINLMSSDLSTERFIETVLHISTDILVLAEPTLPVQLQT